ncbi:MAG: TraR/DksA family transcriptional regulator [Candidatus Goldiibacteriota bacterium]
MDGKRKKELKAMLLRMKKEKINEIKRQNEEIESSDSFKGDAQDFADTASNIYEKELQYDLTEKNKQLLGDIEDGLERIKRNNYGKCNNCGGNISMERLKAVPFAQNCIKCLNTRKTKVKSFVMPEPPKKKKAKKTVKKTVKKSVEKTAKKASPKKKTVKKKKTAKKKK